MALYAISDLHLAFDLNKPMDIFGNKWIKHEEKIKASWMELVNDDDLVLIAGDISWGINQSESYNDLKWIDDLPGKKIISKGNHDYWWGSITKLNKMFDNIKFIQNNFYTYNDYAICGTRGWVYPLETEKDEKIYARELIRLRLSLDAAVKAGYSKIIVMIHYPPTNENMEETEFIKIFKDYNVEKVIYGHIHGYGLSKVVECTYDDVEYIMTSADYLDFKLKKII